MSGARRDRAAFDGQVLALLRAAPGPLTANEVACDLSKALPARDRELGRTIDHAQALQALRRLLAAGLVASATAWRTYAFRGPYRKQAFERKVLVFRVVPVPVPAPQPKRKRGRA